MIIYAVADIHGKLKRLDQMENTVTQYKPDLLIIAGDIITYFRPGPVIRRLSQFGLPVYYIRGNSDPARLDSIAANFGNLHNLHMNKSRIGKFTVMGISGTFPLPFHSKLRLREKKILEEMRKMITPNTCLVVHPPPFKAKDKVAGRFHAGSKGLAALVEKKQPHLVICGHIHEDAGEMTTGQTRILNCSVGKSGKGVLIDIDENGRAGEIRWL